MNEFIFKGTPGQWQPIIELYIDPWVMASTEEPSSAVEVSSATTEDRWLPNSQKEANAFLISAAPDMFEALCMVKHWADVNNLSKESTIYKKIMFALKKATGQNEEDNESGTGGS